MWNESRTNLDSTMGASESKPVVLPVRGPETPIKVDITIYHIPPTTADLGHDDDSFPTMSWRSSHPR